MPDELLKQGLGSILGAIADRQIERLDLDEIRTGRRGSIPAIPKGKGKPFKFAVGQAVHCNSTGIYKPEFTFRVADRYTENGYNKYVIGGLVESEDHLIASSTAEAIQ
jgi:hypothetical protein